MDETGLFFKMTSDKAMQLKGDKQIKDLLTLALAVNLSGTDKLKPVVIRKSAKPHFFKGVANLPVTYHVHKQAWMLRQIIKAWVREFDRRMKFASRQIALFVDNFAAQLRITGLTNIELVFFPPNVTSLLQPFDQGITRNFKVHCRKQSLQLNNH